MFACIRSHKMGRMIILHIVVVDWVTIQMVTEGILKGHWHVVNMNYAVEAFEMFFF